MIHPQAQDSGIGTALLTMHLTERMKKGGISGSDRIFWQSGIPEGQMAEDHFANWIIGNEIKCKKKDWNYMEYTSIRAYVKEYAPELSAYFIIRLKVSQRRQQNIYFPGSEMGQQFQ